MRGTARYSQGSFAEYVGDIQEDETPFAQPTFALPMYAKHPSTCVRRQRRQSVMCMGCCSNTRVCVESAYGCIVPEAHGF